MLERSASTQLSRHIQNPILLIRQAAEHFSLRFNDPAQIIFEFFACFTADLSLRVDDDMDLFPEYCDGELVEIAQQCRAIDQVVEIAHQVDVFFISLLQTGSDAPALGNFELDGRWSVVCMAW